MKIGLIGYGHLGKALAKRTALNIAKSREETPQVTKESEVLILMVRPHHIEETLEQMKPHLTGQTIISFAAAFPLNRMQEIVENKATIVRAMTDIDYKQIVTMDDPIAISTLKTIGQYPLITTNNESDIDGLTVLVGCLPGIAAWQFENNPQAKLWLQTWVEMAKNNAHIPHEVSHSIIESVHAKRNFKSQVEEVATPGGVTASIVEAMKKGEADHTKLFTIGMDRIRNLIQS